MSDIKGEPGMTEESLKRLSGFVKDLNGEPLICSLIFDEMHLHKQIIWNDNKMDYEGFITYGMNEKHVQDEEGNEDKKLPVARKSLIFMLSGINKHFQFPVAYHFVDALTADELVYLVKEVITKVSQCGVKISNLVFDGDRKNVAMCELLGANLDVYDPNFAPFVENPHDKSRIYLMLDPSHMEKLMRNLLGSHSILYDGDDNKIEWKYFVELEKMSREGNILKTHKLTRKHIEFQRNKMNVRLAVETFSNSTGDTMSILREQGHPQFIDSDATIKFVYLMDKLFDVFNSRNVRNDNVYKTALSVRNKREIFEFIDMCKEYLKKLKMVRTTKRKGRKNTLKIDVLKTINRTPVLGFMMCLTNLPLIYKEYVEETKMLKQISTYSFSQDHLELFHGKLRARNGHNDNPNVVQFLGRYDLYISMFINCRIDFLNVTMSNSIFRCIS